MSVVPAKLRDMFTAMNADGRKMPSSRITTEKLRVKPESLENESEDDDKSVVNGEITLTSRATADDTATSDTSRTVNVATPPTLAVDCCALIVAIVSSWQVALKKWKPVTQLQTRPAATEFGRTQTQVEAGGLNT